MMSNLNEELWREEGTWSRYLLKRIFLLITLLGVILAALSAWLTQPIITGGLNARSRTTIDSRRLKDHVSKLSDELYPRNYLNLSNLDRVADYIKSEFVKTGGRVSEQEFFVNGSRYRNIILRIGSSNNERIVVGAHYDAAFDTHGADDNASGVAGLIELAQAISKSSPTLTLEFVAYSLEEPPFFGTEQMGSFVHASSLSRDGVKVRLMISLEMIGFYTDEPNSQAFPIFPGRLLYPTTGDFISLVGNFTNVFTIRRFKASMSTVPGIETYSLNAPAFLTGVDFSDHRNYWLFGYDALMITDTAFFRNKAYHTVGDTSDRLDYAKMALALEAVNNAILDAAN